MSLRVSADVGNGPALNDRPLCAGRNSLLSWQKTNRAQLNESPVNMRATF